MSPIKPALKLWRLIQSHRVTAVIYVAAKLGIAELLRDRPQSLTRKIDWRGQTGAEPLAGRALDHRDLRSRGRGSIFFD